MINLKRLKAFSIESSFLQIMQNNGLQPQHIRTPLARPHVVQGTSSQHRFAK